MASLDTRLWELLYFDAPISRQLFLRGKIPVFTHIEVISPLSQERSQAKPALESKSNQSFNSRYIRENLQSVVAIDETPTSDEVTYTYQCLWLLPRFNMVYHLVYECLALTKELRQREQRSYSQGGSVTRILIHAAGRRTVDLSSWLTIPLGALYDLLVSLDNKLSAVDWLPFPEQALPAPPLAVDIVIDPYSETFQRQAQVLGREAWHWFRLVRVSINIVEPCYRMPVYGTIDRFMSCRRFH
eukprot:Protomagalhaensia_wolfi_Nauph_80__4010@NODE_406_length_2586_cov_54_578720_g32_i1_p2_GENE_NODE_406_length_2586_cov_54_578720_g32_i1NODE_406_length_2586_cov_54_578720_g32_i1_p2_ORF_typecomplete_len243_score12_77Clenterotox/PF03505_14/0_064_NODE_406_length_2586_cov_54_578720_g32_i110901818